LILKCLIQLVWVWVSSCWTIFNRVFTVIINSFVFWRCSFKNLLFQRKLSRHKIWITSNSRWLLSFILSVKKCLLVQLAHLELHAVIWRVVNDVSCYWLAIYKFLKACCILRFWFLALFRTFWISQVLIKLNTINLIFKPIS